MINYLHPPVDRFILARWRMSFTTSPIEWKHELAAISLCSSVAKSFGLLRLDDFKGFRPEGCESILWRFTLELNRSGDLNWSFNGQRIKYMGKISYGNGSANYRPYTENELLHHLSLTRNHCQNGNLNFIGFILKQQAKQWVLTRYIQAKITWWYIENEKGIKLTITKITNLVESNVIESMW